jgi:hypothetical protein
VFHSFISYGLIVHSKEKIVSLALLGLNFWGPRQEQPLREYTLQFARELVDLYHELVHSARGQPALPEHVPPAIQSYNLLPETVGLGFAGLESVFNYLRRNRSLQIPDEWKEHIPPPTSDVVQ